MVYKFQQISFVLLIRNGGMIDEDVIMAIQSIQVSLAQLWGKLDFEYDEKLLGQIHTALEHAVRDQVLEVLHFALIPQIKKWQAGLERAFQKYLVS